MDGKTTPEATKTPQQVTTPTLPQSGNLPGFGSASRVEVNNLSFWDANMTAELSSNNLTAGTGYTLAGDCFPIGIADVFVTVATGEASIAVFPPQGNVSAGNSGTGLIFRVTIYAAQPGNFTLLVTKGGTSPNTATSRISGTVIPPM